MKDLLSGNYFPFGSQYYRAPSPKREDWENDIKNMAGLGFNTIKYWVQWRWNNPGQDEYYFDDIDELMDLAQKYNLKVMLNTIFDVAPAWIYANYPDASMLTLGGKRVGPQTQPHRQIGGLGWCFNHDDVERHMLEFLKVTVERYKDHPALEIWNVGSEPELTSSMAELRRVADDADRIDDLLCYCDRCKIEFRRWLKNKYKSIDELNHAWNRNYKSFLDIERPKTRNTFNDMIDWRMFFVDTLGNNVKKRFETASEADNGKHSLMCHHVFIQGFPVVSTANDPWNVAQYGDLHGFTQMDDTSMIDILRSAGRGKPVISAEMLMLPGYTLDLPQKIDQDDVKRFVFSGIAGNLKGFIFWQYRPEILGREAPTWGLTTLDGKPTPWLKAFAETGKVLQKNKNFLWEAEPKKAKAAIYYNPENQAFIWEATGNEKNATHSALGFHKALYERNYIIDFLHPVDFNIDRILDQYKVLILPASYVVPEEIAEKIKRWVENGGFLIGEAYTAGWDIKNGCHATVVPGYGLHEVFKTRQDYAVPARDEENYVEVVIENNLKGLDFAGIVEGTIVKEILKPEGSKVLARYKDGNPAITFAEYGKGKAVLMGSYFGLAYFNLGELSAGNFITGLIETGAHIERPQIEDNRRVRVDILTREKEQIMIVRNLESSPVNAGIFAGFEEGEEYEEQFTGEKIKTVKNEKGVLFNVHLNEKEVKVFRV